MSPPPENSPQESRRKASAGDPSAHTGPAEYSAEERRLLLQVAHESILAKLEDREISLDPPTPHLAEKRGAFTTLYLEG